MNFNHMMAYNKIWLGIGLVITLCMYSSCTKEANALKQNMDPGKITLLKVVSSSRVAKEYQMADMPYIDDYEVEKVMTDSTENGINLKKLIDSPSNYLVGEVMMQCTSSPDYYVSWANDKNKIYGINITSGCPMLFLLAYEADTLKTLNAQHILAKKIKKFTKALKEIQ